MFYTTIGAKDVIIDGVNLNGYINVFGYGDSVSVIKLDHDLWRLSIQFRMFVLEVL